MPQNLSYPLDVEGADQQGHYIMFMINETTSGKVATGGSGAGATGGMGDFAADVVVAGFQGKKFIDSNLNAGAGQAQQATFQGAVKGSGLWMKRPGTTRMSQAITLYMPPSVKVSYKSNYKNDEIGALAQGIATTGASLIEGLSAGLDLESIVKGGAGKTALAGAAAFTADKAVRMANTAAPGAQTLAQISAGSILGSKMEVMFTDVGRRNFSFAFNFIPKSEQEARMVYDIVQTFKEHMLPEYLSSIDIKFAGINKVDFAAGRLLKIPDTFDIFYFFHDNENPFLNRISTCYLTSLDIDYGGDKYVTYEPIELDGQVGPPPQRTNITLAFTEIETITRERAKEGF